MNAERVGMIVTLITIITQSGLYLLSGGFAVGEKMSQIESDIKVIKQEIVTSNQLQDYRLDKLEVKNNEP